MIPFNRASFDGNELKYLAEAVLGGHVSGNGPFSRRAEALLSAGHRQGKALLATSCTHALELSALLLDLQPGDEVIVPSFTFVTTASAFMLHGATPVFVDVRDDTLNIDLEAAEAAITDRTRAICIVHYGGVAAQPDRFAALAARHGLTLIEDNAHGLFGSFQGQPLGTFGALSTLSFHETKNVTCGEGGALIINDKSFLERAEILREKGTDRSRFLRGQVDKYTWVDIGSSWVLSDLLAGVLVGQLERFDQIWQRRRVLWDRYESSLAAWADEHGVVMPVVPDGCEHTSHLFHLRFSDIDIRDRYISHLRSNGAAAVFHYQALHLSTVGRGLGGYAGMCPVSELASETLVRLPLFVDLTADEQDLVIAATCSFRA
jgi:dTDP-4-amino-4,6-dideoxygalactose transaminase